MGKNNVTIEGRTSEIDADTINPGGPTIENGGNPDVGEGGSGAGGGTELHSPISVGSGPSDTGSGSSETGASPRKRGRPKGSANAKPKSGLGGMGRGGGRNHSELRGKLEQGLTGATCFGFSAFGTMRAAKYKQTSIGLANAVFGCYQIKESNAATIAKPLSECLVEYLPDTWLQGIASTIDPVTVCAAFYLIVKQCMDNEKEVVKDYHKRLIAHNQRQQEVSPDTPDAPIEGENEEEVNLINMAMAIATQGSDTTDGLEQPAI